MSRRIARGAVAGAHGAQNRAMGFTLALAAPFAVAFMIVPDLIMAALFSRGAFDLAAAQRAGAVLAAYAVGLPATVLIRSAVASFYARTDTTTPVIAALIAVAVNVLLKIALTDRFGVVGLALGTAAGAWVNLLLLLGLAYRRDWTAPSPALWKMLAAIIAASLVLVLFAIFAQAPIGSLLVSVPAYRDEAGLTLLGAGGILIYGAVLAVVLRLLGVRLARA